MSTRCSNTDVCMASTWYRPTLPAYKIWRH